MKIKKIVLKRSFSAVVHLEKAFVTARSKTVPDYQSSVYSRNYYHLFK